MSKTKLDISSIQPGFIVISYEPHLVDPQHISLSDEQMVQWKERGYFGGIIIPKGTDWKSYSDEQLAEFGLQRIKK